MSVAAVEFVISVHAVHSPIYQGRHAYNVERRGKRYLVEHVLGFLQVKVVHRRMSPWQLRKPIQVTFGAVELWAILFQGRKLFKLLLDSALGLLCDLLAQQSQSIKQTQGNQTGYRGLPRTECLEALLARLCNPCSLPVHPIRTEKQQPVLVQDISSLVHSLNTPSYGLIHLLNTSPPLPIRDR